jgi:hypothetical protein
MTPIAMNMSSKKDLVDKIAKILKADGDLDFLAKLSPKDLTALASHLKVLSEQKN